MQALSRSNDSVLLNFEAIEELVININILFGEKIDYFNNEKIKDKNKLMNNEKKLSLKKHRAKWLMKLLKVMKN